MLAASQYGDSEARVVELSILMPCLNEAETLAVCIEKALSFLKREGIAGEVIVADNGSTDGSPEIATAHGARLVHVPQRGYGAAVLGGIAAARGAYIIMGDADDSYDFTSLGSFLEKLRAGADLVMGNRFKGGISDGAMPPLHRYFGNPVLSGVGRLFFGIPIGDFHCGLRGLRTASVRRLGLAAPGMEFASEMVVRAALEGQRIEEVPTTLRPDGRSRPPHLKSFRDGWRHLKLLLMHSPRWLFFIPGALMVIVGAALAAALYAGPVAIDHDVALDLNSFVAACFLVISGVQLLSFGVLARHYAAATGMLPRGPGGDWIVKNVTVDNAVRTAVVLLILGLAAFGRAVWDWASVGFGDLHNAWTPRTVVAALSCVVIAVQLGFQAFMIGILQIPLARRQASLERPSFADQPGLTA
jgi:glycosyltransferase involved in cell wall biosynthesis